MNKHLNNFLDKLDELPENTSNNNIQKELVRQGYKAKRLTCNKGTKFIGWSK